MQAVQHNLLTSAVMLAVKSHAKTLPVAGMTAVCDLTTTQDHAVGRLHIGQMQAGADAAASSSVLRVSMKADPDECLTHRRGADCCMQGLPITQAHVST